VSLLGIYIFWLLQFPQVLLGGQTTTDAVQTHHKRGPLHQDVRRCHFSEINVDESSDTQHFSANEFSCRASQGNFTTELVDGAAGKTIHLITCVTSTGSTAAAHWSFVIYVDRYRRRANVPGKENRSDRIALGSWSSIHAAVANTAASVNVDQGRDSTRGIQDFRARLRLGDGGSGR
jgi:hypothetical protein